MGQKRFKIAPPLPRTHEKLSFELFIEYIQASYHQIKKKSCPYATCHVYMYIQQKVYLGQFIFQNNVLPSGEKSVESQSIIVQDLSRHHSGTYICTASNGVGQSASSEINLKVLCKYLFRYHTLFFCVEIAQAS